MWSIKLLILINRSLDSYSDYRNITCVSTGVSTLILIRIKNALKIPVLFNLASVPWSLFDFQKKNLNTLSVYSGCYGTFIKVFTWR